MTIGLAIPSLNPGGAERVITTLANHWADKNYLVHLFVFDQNESFYQLHKNIKIHRIVSKQSKNPLNKILGILKPVDIYKDILQSVKPDVVISFMTIVNLFSIKACNSLNIPVIISERNNILDTPHKLHWSFLRNRTYKNANGIVLQTKRSERCFNVLNIKLPSTKSVIFNPLSNEYIRDVNFESKENKIISIGRFDNYKQQDMLIRAASTIDLEDWKIQFVGDGKRKQEIENLVKELKMENQVEFLGKRKDVPDLLAKASVYALTSKSEGFPNALCEALASGCACISFDCEFGPNEIINEKNGILVKPNDLKQLSHSLNNLIKSESKRSQLGKNAIQIQNELNIEAIAKQWELIIEELVHSQV